MKFYDRLLYALSISVLLAGLRIVFMWGHTSKLLGLGLVSISLLVIYINYIKDKKNIGSTAQVNMEYVGLGLFLIAIDVAWNIYFGDEFRSFDYGMLLSGLFIIFLNIGMFGFLKFDRTMISFTTYFVFILMLVLCFSSAGISLIYDFMHRSDGSTNPLYIIVTNLSIKTSVFFLKFIKPTTLIENSINFDGFEVSISYPCSGIESMTVFLSAVIAYFIAIKGKNIKRMFICTVVGIIALYFMNILRILLIILVGYHFGKEAMFFTHNNLGWIMFVIGMGVFWYLVFEGREDHVK